MPSNESIKAGLALIEADKSKVLGVALGERVVEPGQYIPRADAQDMPALSFAVPDPDGTYMVMGLDLDAPFPSFGILGPVLHWLQPGLKAGHAEGGHARALEATGPFVANYLGPGPPPGSAPHRYCFFLYEQPAEFDVEAHAPPDGTKLGNWSSLRRMRFSLDDWERRVGLGPILAVNYYTSN